MIISLILCCFPSNKTAGEEGCEALYELTNSYRQQNGKEPFEKDPALEKAAKNQAEYCAKTGALSHQQNDPQNADVGSRVKNAGFEHMGVAENATETYEKNAEEAFSMWKKSEGHNQNLLIDFKKVGYAFAKGQNGSFYWIGVYANGNGGNGQDSGGKPGQDGMGKSDPTSPSAGGMDSQQPNQNPQ